MWGFHYEQDTPRYLLNIRHLYNPPLYSLILRFITILYANLYFTIILQTFVFSAIITFFAYREKQNHRIEALFWAFEPFSTFYCSNLMSEWLFIALLYACYVEFKKFQYNFHIYNLFSLIVCSFLLYMTRYIGITFLFYFILYLIFHAIQEKKFILIKTIGIAIMVFLVLSIPIRIINFYTFGTWAVSAYDGLNFWNSVSVLYPSSQVQKNPQSDFEKFLSNYPDSIFSTHNALMTNHMWMDSFPALAYAQKNHLSPTELNTVVTQTAVKIFTLNSIYDYFQKFVLPNFLKPFQLKKEKIGIEITYHYIENFFGRHQLPDFYYRYEFILFLLSILFMNLFLKPLHFFNNYLIFYWVFIGLTSAIFMRYLYVIIPFALYSSMEIMIIKNQSKIY